MSEEKCKLIGESLLTPSVRVYAYRCPDTRHSSEDLPGAIARVQVTHPVYLHKEYYQLRLELEDNGSVREWLEGKGISALRKKLELRAMEMIFNCWEQEDLSSKSKWAFFDEEGLDHWVNVIGWDNLAFSLEILTTYRWALMRPSV